MPFMNNIYLLPDSNIACFLGLERRLTVALCVQGWFYKLALLDFELIFEVKMQESEGV